MISKTTKIRTMDTYKIHFKNPENNYSISKEFTEKNLPFKPETPIPILELENTYFLLKSHNNKNEYFYERVEGEQVGITQEEIDKEWYMILDWNYFTLTPDPYDE